MRIPRGEDVGIGQEARHSAVVQRAGQGADAANNRDLYGGFEEARPKVERAIRIGAPGGGYI